MDWFSIIGGIAQIFTALGTIFILIQIYLHRRNYKADTIKQLFQTFFSSQKLNEFSISISMALVGIDDESHKENNHTRKALIGDLKDYKNQMSNNAMLYSRFLGYIYYSIENRLISPKDVAGINGKWINDYYRIKKYIEKNHNDFPKDLIEIYWPDMPGALKKEIEAVLRTGHG